MGQAAQVLNGFRDGFPLCCIAQFVNDGFNEETVYSGAIRRGLVLSEKGRCHYVPCFDCDEKAAEETRYAARPNDHGVRYARIVARPKVLIAQ